MSSKPTITVFTTKYAMTTGQVFETKVTDQGNGTCVRRGGAGWDFFKFDIDAFHTREAAVADAEKRRRQRIEDLQRQIDKLEGFDFA